MVVLPIGPDSHEWNRKTRAVKASDICAIVFADAGTDQPLFLDMLGEDTGRYAIGVSVGPRTQFSCLDWGFEMKPAGSPSMEIPYEKEIFTLVMFGPKEVYLNVGDANDAGGFELNASEEDRSPTSALYIEALDPIPGDPKVSFSDRVRFKSYQGDKTTYLQLHATDGVFGVRMVPEKDMDPASTIWHIKHGNDYLGTGIREVGYKPEDFPPKPE
mmetsp:Transcript_24668/g.33336  ORF Transcript_24668/g.33336 Transcript_24668/m.33336 type:complete len:215 (+) Transcript_24668:33-677(+)